MACSYIIGKLELNSIEEYFALFESMKTLEFQLPPLLPQTILKGIYIDRKLKMIFLSDQKCFSLLNLCIGQGG